MATRLLPSPLADAYFSDFNKESIQDKLIQAIKAKTGIEIERQNYADLDALMKRVWVNKRQDTFTNVRQQVEDMDDTVVKEAVATISSGLLQQVYYMRDISENPMPLPISISTSTYGNKIPINNKFGINK